MPSPVDSSPRVAPRPNVTAPPYLRATLSSCSHCLMRSYVYYSAPSGVPGQTALLGKKQWKHDPKKTNRLHQPGMLFYPAKSRFTNAYEKWLQLRNSKWYL